MKQIHRELLLLKKLLLLTVTIFVLSSFSLAISVNASTTAWTQVYRRENSEAAFSMIPTSDGGYALVGYSAEGGVRVFFIKADAQGNMEWDRTYGGSQSTIAYSVAETLDGGYVITGYTIQSDTAEWDAFLLKTDTEGNMQWNQTYEGPEEDAAQAVVATPDGGYAIVGVRNILSPEGGDLWLITTDSSGNMLLNITYHNTGRYATKSLVVTQDGGLAIAGTIMDLEMEEADVSLIKLDKFGNIELNKTYGGPEKDSASSLVATADRGYAIAGSTGDSFEDGDFWLVKTDASGNMEWNRTYGGPDREVARSLVATSDGGYAILGQKGDIGGGDFWLVKTNSTGHMEWNQTHIETGEDLASSLAEAPDGGYVFAGAWKAFSSESDFCLIKTNEFVNRHEFYFHWGYNTYSILVWSNSTLGDFNFGLYDNEVSFSVTGPTGTTGFCQIIIPAEIVGDNLPVYMNEIELVEDVDYTRTYNGTHIILDFNYNHSTHTIEITGTTPLTTIPEYSSWLIPTMLLIATLFIAINKKVRIGSKKWEP